jgi:ABC-type uncharacterized transport system substrate-binding protein
LVGGERFFDEVVGAVPHGPDGHAHVAVSRDKNDGDVGRYERLPALFAELVRLNVDVIVTHGTPRALAAKQVTNTIPIVVAVIADPEASGVVASSPSRAGT